MSDSPELPPIAAAPISVVLTAHNEAPHLEEVLAAWAARLDALNREYEVLIVDAGSTDGTAALVEALAPRLPRVRPLRPEGKPGFGPALQAGVAAARHPLLLTCTSDRQYQLADLALLLAEIDKVHVATGYRVARPFPIPLRVLGWLYRAFVRVALAHPLEPLAGWLGWRGHLDRLAARLAFGLRVHDVGCPFRLYRRVVFERIPIQSQGDFALVEVLAKANFLGCMMTEVPVRHQPRPAKGAAEAAAVRKQIRSDFLRAFTHPDFGPPVLPPEALTGGAPANIPPG
jgi:glycosyltransferase involved in cell wall biosynthesis